MAVITRERKGAVLRWVRWASIGLVTLELLYVVAGNSFLQQAWGRDLINRRPDKLAVSWESGSTWLPGLVHVEGLDLRGTSRRVAWKARMDRGTMLVWLPSLAQRHLEVLWGRPVGAEVDVDLLPPPQEPEAPAAMPAAAGTAGTVGTRPGWRVTLGGLGLEELRRIRVGAYELAGSGSLRGAASFQIRGPMELHIDRLLFADAQVLSGGTVVAQDLDIDGGFDTAPFRTGQDRVRDLVGGASGRAHLGAHVDNLGFLTAYLGGISWLGLGGVGDLDLTVALDDGSLLPGTSLTVTGPEVRADFFDFRAQGKGRVSGEVPEAGGELRLSAVLDEYSVTRLSDGAGLLAGQGLEVRFASRSTGLARPPTDIVGSLHAPPAEVTSLAAFGAYLPPGTTATVTGGRAELSLDLSYDTGARDGRGHLLIDAKQVKGTFGDADISGDLRLEADMPHLDLLAGKFDVSGTGISIAHARMVRNGKQRTRDWWGRVQVSSGSVQRRLSDESRELAPSAPALVTADLRGQLLDTAPLLVLMEQRLSKLGWFEGLLTIQKIELLGTVTLEGAAMGLSGIHVTGGRDHQLEIRAELDLAGRRTTGVAYARYRAIDATLALDEGARDWRMRHAKRAYEEAALAYRARHPGPH